MSIKVIDYRDGDASTRFAASLKEIGFSVLSHHPVDQGLIDKAYQAWEEFFRSEDKHNYPFDASKHDGYVNPSLSETAKGHTVKDIKEFFHYYKWGRCPEYLRETTQKLFEALTALASQLLSWVEGNTPDEIKRQFSVPLREMIENSPTTLFRLIHYPPLTGNETPGAIRAAAHEDINLLTLLTAATAKGLQVQNSEGEWIDVPCDPNWIIVNTGDMLQECTQGYYPATTHRVANPEGSAATESRLSMPLFLHPREDIRLSERHTANSYRLERYGELGLD